MSLSYAHVHWEDIPMNRDLPPGPGNEALYLPLFETTL